MRYWSQPPATLATTGDLIDLVDLEPDAGWVELTAQTYEDAVAGLAAQASIAVPPVLTSLRGNGHFYTTSDAAKKVTISIIHPVGGNLQGRPQLNGVPICATPGGAPFLFVQPGPLTIVTTAGNNDLIVVEEF